MTSPDRPTPMPAPPEIRGLIIKMEEIMRQRDYNHAGVPTQLAVDLGRSGKIHSFAQFETLLRQLGSRIYFIAVPLDYYVGDGTFSLTTIYPFGHSEEEKPEFTLHVCVNGALEAGQMLERLNITQDENSRRLYTTGVLSISENSKLAE